MATLILETAIRATLIAGSTAAVLWALRIKTAAGRHLAWSAVVVAMLLLPLWSVSGLKLPLRVLRPASAISALVDAPRTGSSAIESAEGIAPAAPPLPVPPPFDWQRVVATVYVAGAGILLARLIAGTSQSRRLRRSAVTEDGLPTNSFLATPITIGWFAPVMILPSGWQRWSSGKLDAVLTHEREHIRRRDPLVQWLALLNRAIFWFHPLAWWLERHIAALAEEACDAAVLAAGHAPQAYANYLLDLARSVTQEGRRIRTVGMAMPGAGLRSRLGRILDGLSMPSVSRARAVATALLCLVSSGLFAAGTLGEQASPAKTQGENQKFAVASVKPCDGGAAPGPSERRVDAGGVSLNTITVPCQTVIEMIARAYMIFGNPPPLNSLNRFDPDKIAGAPAWARSERYAIEAKADGAPGPVVMMGAMLRALLEERFELKLHQELKDVPAFALTVAATGLKVTPADPSSCTTEAFIAGAAREAGDRPRCTSSLIFNGPNLTFKATGQSFDLVAQSLGPMLFGRVVVDQTAAAGIFNFSVEFARDENTPARAPVLTDPSSVPAAPSVFTAFEKLGLKFVSTKAPQAHLVIDRLSRPSPDNPLTPAILK